MFDSKDISSEFSYLSSQYEIIKLVGQGSYGIVVKALKKQTKQIVAIKKFSNLYRDIIDTKRILREIAILRQLSEHPHPNIISIYDIIIPNESTVNEIYMIMEYCEMDLKSFIYSKYTIPTEYIKKIISDCLNGLLHLVKRGIIHRDIKPANILINTKPEFAAKICDFGLAREMTLDFSTEELLEVFFSEMAFGKQFTEEGISYEIIKRGLEEQSLSSDLKVYMQQKLEELSYKILCYKNSKNNKNELNDTNYLYQKAIFSNIKIHNFIQDTLSNQLGIHNYYDLYNIYKKEDMKLRSNLTPHIITRWYRPPEILLLENVYSYTVDIWSLGCVLGEMLLSSINERHPMFPGESSYLLSPKIEKGNLVINTNEQMFVILSALGTVNDDDLSFISRKEYKQFVVELNKNVNTNNIIYKNKFDSCDPCLVTLMRNMLKFNPIERIGIKEAIQFIGVTEKIDEKEYEPIVNIWEDNKVNWTFDKIRECFLYEYSEYKVRNLIDDIEEHCKISDIDKENKNNIEDMMDG